MRYRRLLVMLALVTLLIPSPMALARVKLAALPDRERVVIRLDHGLYTLVEEERIVPLLKSGAHNNMIDFSWSNSAISKETILFRPVAISEGDGFRPIRMIDGPGGSKIPEVNVINVAYPPSENALVWEVYAANACACKVRVSYLISNLSRTFEYRALADKDEERLTLRNYMVLHNYSGEDFLSAGLWAGFGPVFQKDVSQQDDIKLLLAKFDSVPIQKTFTFDWYANGPLNADKPQASRVLMHYRLTNDEQHKLGQFPLQGGKVRIFMEDSHGGEAFLGEDVAQLTPLDDTMKLYLGESRDIVCTRFIEANQRHHVRGNLYNQEIVIRYEIENYKDKAATLRIIEQVNRLGSEYFGQTHGDVEWTKAAKTSDQFRFDYELGGTTPTLLVDLPARPADKDQKVEKTVVRFHVTLKNLWQD